MESETKITNGINKLILGQGLRRSVQGWKTGSKGLNQESTRAEGRETKGRENKKPVRARANKRNKMQTSVVSKTDYLHDLT